MMISSQELQDPAYRATLLNHKWAGAKSPLTFLFQIVSGLTQPIPNFAKFSGKKVGLRTDFSDIQELFVVVGRHNFPAYRATLL